MSTLEGQWALVTGAGVQYVVRGLRWVQGYEERVG